MNACNLSNYDIYKKLAAELLTTNKSSDRGVIMCSFKEEEEENTEDIEHQFILAHFDSDIKNGKINAYLESKADRLIKLKEQYDKNNTTNYYANLFLTRSYILSFDIAVASHTFNWNPGTVNRDLIAQEASDGNTECLRGIYIIQELMASLYYCSIAWEGNHHVTIIRPSISPSTSFLQYNGKLHVNIIFEQASMPTQEFKDKICPLYNVESQKLIMTFPAQSIVVIPSDTLKLIGFEFAVCWSDSLQAAQNYKEILRKLVVKLCIEYTLSTSTVDGILIDSFIQFHDVNFRNNIYFSGEMHSKPIALRFAANPIFPLTYAPLHCCILGGYESAVLNFKDGLFFTALIQPAEYYGNILRIRTQTPKYIIGAKVLQFDKISLYDDSIHSVHYQIINLVKLLQSQPGIWNISFANQDTFSLCTLFNIFNIEEMIASRLQATFTSALTAFTHKEIVGIVTKQTQIYYVRFIYNLIQYSAHTLFQGILKDAVKMCTIKYGSYKHTYEYVFTKRFIEHVTQNELSLRVKQGFEKATKQTAHSSATLSHPETKEPTSNEKLSPCFYSSHSFISVMNTREQFYIVDCNINRQTEKYMKEDNICNIRNALVFVHFFLNVMNCYLSKDCSSLSDNSSKIIDKLTYFFHYPLSRFKGILTSPIGRGAMGLFGTSNVYKSFMMKVICNSLVSKESDVGFFTGNIWDAGNSFSASIYNNRKIISVDEMDLMTPEQLNAFKHLAGGNTTDSNGKYSKDPLRLVTVRMYFFTSNDVDPFDSELSKNETSLTTAYKRIISMYSINKTCNEAKKLEDQIKIDYENFMPDIISYFRFFMLNFNANKQILEGRTGGNSFQYHMKYANIRDITSFDAHFSNNTLCRLLFYSVNIPIFNENEWDQFNVSKTAIIASREEQVKRHLLFPRLKFAEGSDFTYCTRYVDLFIAFYRNINWVPDLCPVFLPDLYVDIGQDGKFLFDQKHMRDVINTLIMNSYDYSIAAFVQYPVTFDEYPNNKPKLITCYTSFKIFTREEMDDNGEIVKSFMTAIEDNKGRWGSVPIKITSLAQLFEIYGRYCLSKLQSFTELGAYDPKFKFSKEMETFLGSTSLALSSLSFIDYDYNLDLTFYNFNAIENRFPHPSISFKKDNDNDLDSFFPEVSDNFKMAMVSKNFEYGNLQTYQKDENGQYSALNSEDSDDEGKCFVFCLLNNPSSTIAVSDAIIVSSFLNMDKYSEKFEITDSKGTLVIQQKASWGTKAKEKTKNKKRSTIDEGKEQSRGKNKVSKKKK